MVKCTVDGVDKDGKPIHWACVGKFDGKPYQIKGSPSFDMLTYKPVNDRTNKTTATKAGKVVMTGTITVAKDGKSRVVRLTGTNANGQKFTDITYYDKQHYGASVGEAVASPIPNSLHFPDPSRRRMIRAALVLQHSQAFDDVDGSSRTVAPLTRSPV